MSRKLCEHNRRRYRCVKCGGTSICEHKRRRDRCVKCGGASICEHKQRRSQCKKCGTYKKFLKGGFSSDQIKEMGAVKQCQYPGCLILNNALHSDHFHDGAKINTENYRGEICLGHNLLLSDLDEHPEWDTAESREYKQRRPYRKFGESS